MRPDANDSKLTHVRVRQDTIRPENFGQENHLNPMFPSSVESSHE
jgi:hypothetical protein